MFSIEVGVEKVVKISLQIRSLLLSHLSSRQHGVRGAGQTRQGRHGPSSDVVLG